MEEAENNVFENLTEIKLGFHRRSSSFMKTGFASLAQNEDDEKELNAFFTAEKQFIILTNAGKPVYSL